MALVSCCEKQRAIFEEKLSVFPYSRFDERRWGANKYVKEGVANAV